MTIPNRRLSLSFNPRPCLASKRKVTISGGGGC
jgi:hypothetical protein